MSLSPQDNAALSLRRQAEEGAALPALLIAAEHLAATVQMGGHGRRRAGPGEEFWQYRPAHSGDAARFVDWRRSARSDAQFVRDREWQLAQSLHLWVDDAASMRFSGAPSGRHARPTKAGRAQVLALALAVLAIRAGERVGLTGPLAPPRPGRAQLVTLASVLASDAGATDYGAPEVTGIAAQARAVFLSDFFGDLGAIERALGALADRGVSGVMVQVLDPAEEDFPFDGRTIFESMAGGLRHETREAGDLRARYVARLAERRARLADLALKAGWQFSTHHTGAPAQAALLWLHGALERGAR
ncbi:MAG: DUF58 domain-containing protein [Paenirhodobacter sp.]|uniref:DUF58 domain-containing protein n=1 Tax=Paenirhodobacter sp. TaxID=1965326 RepID=UPI003D142513